MDSLSAHTQLSDRELATSEHSARVMRLRKLARIGLCAWPLFGLVDLFIVLLIQPSARLWFFWTIRLAGMVPLALASWRLAPGHPIGTRELRATEISVLTVLSVLITLTCAEFRGIDSPLALGVITLLVGRGALAADHYRQALLPVATVTLAHPLTLIALALISPNIASQFAAASSFGGFVVNQLFLFGAAALSLLGGHALWALQRKVFEARSFGRYRLIERIGKGGMGEVWSAHHRTLKRRVAVKILRPDKQFDEVAQARFEREVQATAELTHPNTVRVFDYGVTEDGLCYYAMELLEGKDLGALLREQGKLPPAKVLSLILQATRALAEAHSRGIVHRDLKPENLFVAKISGSEEVLKVFDFGLARDQANEAGLTREGFAPGTPSYISPEVLLGNQADARSDVYALGCVMYHALVGSPPFVGKDVHEVLGGHLRSKPRPLRHAMTRPIAAGVEAVVMRCLEKEPAQRFANAGELAEALLAALRSLRQGAQQPGRARAAKRAPAPYHRASGERGSVPLRTRPPVALDEPTVPYPKGAGAATAAKGTIAAPPSRTGRTSDMASGLIELSAEHSAPPTTKSSRGLEGVTTGKVLVTSAAIRPHIVDPEDADTLIDQGPPAALRILAAG